MNDLTRRSIAEAIGTFILVFASAGAAVVDLSMLGPIGHIGGALATGLAVVVMVYAIGEISGAHINPAVTFGFWVARRFPGREVPWYIVAQIGGAIAAAALLAALFPGLEQYGLTAPAIEEGRAFGLEITLTAILMLVILCVTTGSKEIGLMAGIAIGGTVAMEALFAGPATGASMNPARTLGPAIVSGAYPGVWLYLVGTPIGAAIAAGLLQIIRPRSQQRG